MSSPYASQDSFEYGLYDQFEETQTQGTDVAHRGTSPGVSLDNTVETDPFTQQETPRQTKKLDFCPLSEWDEEKTYDKNPQSYIHYLIEWKVTVNNRVVSKDTEQNVVLAPAVFWRSLLQLKLEKLLCRKLARNRPVRSEDTNVVISVAERSQRDLAKRFDDTNVDWSVVEKQLVLWGDFFRAGKKLRVCISFNYVETSQLSTTSSRKAGKRGASSTTQQMLAERDTQLEAERESSGHPSIWRDVYELMRCPQPSCNSGPHCWRDPVGKKHYKLTTHHLRSLIQHVEQGLVLQTHDDVPEEVRQQLYAEEQKAIEKRQKPPNTPSGVLIRWNSGDKEDEELRGILDRLDRAREELVLRISVVQVGVVGNIGDGFCVAFDVLMETNKKVHEILGINLVLADRLKDRELRAARTIPLDASDTEILGLPGGQGRPRRATAVDDETSIYDNITVGQARIMTGSVGVENWSKVGGRKTTISHNKFGQDVRIMTGDQAGEAAAHFNDNFWT